MELRQSYARAPSVVFRQVRYTVLNGNLIQGWRFLYEGLNGQILFSNMHADASGRVVKGAKYRWGWLSCSPGQHQQVLYFVILRWLFAECGG